MPAPLRVLSRTLVAAAATLCSACATATVPDPKHAAEEYAAAAERGDVDGIYGMLSKRSRATMTKADVATVLANAKLELADQAKAIRAGATNIVAMARVRYEDGSEAALTLGKDGRFYVATAGLLPGGGSSPEEALAGLRDALRRRSYPALLRVLTPQLRAAVEAQLKGLVDVLENPSALQIPPAAGDEIEVRLPNGHRVKLRRDTSTNSWFVENFE